uniref:Integrase catalytic domain-containing protein n=1 Tax=Monodelphis domestica TaxID=13616 RepID=K7E2S9_MONDO
MFTRPGKKWALVVFDRKDRLKLVKQAHITSSGVHCSLPETKKKVSFSYYWPTLVRDVTQWVKQCSCLQKSRSERSLPIQGVTKSHRGKDPLPVLQVESVTQAFEQVGMGVVGPLVETPNGFRFILLSVDAYSRWVEASPLKEQNPVEVAGALIPFLLRFGRPQLLVTTLRVPFVNQVNRSLRRQLQSLGVPLGKLDIVMSAFQPKINSILAMTSSCIRKTLWNLLKGDLEKWDRVLDRALFTLRTAVTKNKRRSPFQILYGRKPRAAQEVPSHFDVVAADTVTGDLEASETRDPVPKPMERPKQDSMPEPTQQSTLQPTPQSTLQLTLQPTPQSTLQPTQQSTQQPIQQSTQQPIQQSTQQPIQQSTLQPIQQSTLQPIQQSTQQPLQQSIQQPIPQCPQQLRPELIQQSMLESMQQPILEPGQPSGSEPMGQLLHQPLPEPLYQHIWQPMLLGSLQQPIQQPLHPLIQQPMPLPNQQPMQLPMQLPLQQPMQQSLPQPIQQLILQPIQQPMQQSMQQPIQQLILQPIQQLIHQPIQQPMPQVMAEPLPPPLPRVTECHVASNWCQQTAPALEAPWEKWEPGGGAFWTQWRDPGN